MSTTAAVRAEGVRIRRDVLKYALMAIDHEILPRCAHCGRSEVEFHPDGTQVSLEFDHIGPTRDWCCHQLSRWQRMKKYEEESLAGEIQLLCSKCNKLKGQP